MEGGAGGSCPPFFFEEIALYLLTIITGDEKVENRVITLPLISRICMCQILLVGSICMVSAVYADSDKSPLSQEKETKSDTAANGINGAVNTVSRVAARVGNVDITDADIDEMISQQHPNLASHVQDYTKILKYRREALTTFIEIELLFYKATKEGMLLSNEEVDAVVERNAANLGSLRALHETLAYKGFTIEQFRHRIRSLWAANNMLLKLIAESQYDEEKLRKYYEEKRETFRRPESAHIYHIFISVASSATDEERSRKRLQAEEIRQRIVSGEKFYDIAYQNSDAPHRVKGGDLGFVHKGMLEQKELDDAVFSLKKGELSPVIQAIDGFHLFMAVELKEGELLSFESVKKDLATRLQKERYEEKRERLIRQLKEEVSVQIFQTFEEKP